MTEHARAAAWQGLPVISVAGLSAPSRARREEVGAALHVACRDMGFFYCVDHGVPAGLIAAVFAQSRAFFALPEAEKEALTRTVPPATGATNPCVTRRWNPARRRT
ncbi:2-oxoglutarate and iron-dependent oxygenase domain-containing protein [Komagataeibacter kakiaceti]|uniref:2-oxoglutarate and iron-dependent oxygenase domain-containing protein n=1 Tax=Komagataeibacter kakiaceti TaxID=943261 RepID=UPI000B030152|nr:2-oxoglutarate and iron-dependent oxygenase domain-containing protein [Komagataeibacter kakiaceti]